MTVDVLARRRNPKVPAIRCARCDTRLADPSRRVFSTHTRKHYCSAVDVCARRAARKAKASA